MASCLLAAFPEPLPLLERDEQGRFHVVEATARALTAITKPVVVVAIVGRYRTGKSFLMNRLAGTKTGFPLGGTVQGQTRGIWAWLRPHPRDTDQCLLLLDTEGQGDVQNTSDDQDTWLFVLALLLSSTLVFNTTGTLDKDGMEQLHFVLNMTDHVRTRVHQNEDNIGCDFHRYFPSLVMCVRDFTLTLEVDGRPCSDDDYMEHCLQMRKKGMSRMVREFNEHRQMLCDYFKKRKCYVFPVPADAQDLEHLEVLPDERINPKFLNVTDKFIKHILDFSKVKHVSGTVVSTHIFIELLEQYTLAQWEGTVPCIESALVQVVMLANLRAKDAALALYRERMGPVAEQLPLSMLELNARRQQAMNAAVTLFHDRSVLDKEHTHENQLMKTITEDHMAMTLKIAEESKRRCKECLIRLYEPIKEKVQDGEFYRPGGFQQYHALMDKLQADYSNTPGLGFAQETVLMAFMDQTQDTGSNILMMDKGISQVEKIKQEDEEQKKRSQQKSKAMQEQIQQKQAQMESLKNQLETNKTEFDKKMKNIETKTSFTYEDMGNEDDGDDTYETLGTMVGGALQVAFTVLMIL